MSARIALQLLGLLTLSATAMGEAVAHVGPAPAAAAFPGEWVQRIIKKKAFREPSGLCRHVKRGTLFVVGDEGDICEFTPDGKILRQVRVRRGDFEGITHDPGTGLLYVAVEGEEKVLEIDPDTLKVLREFDIPRQFNGKTVMKAGGQGIEGITFVPDAAHVQGGTFLVANQVFSLTKKGELSAVFEVELPLRQAEAEPRLLRYFEPGVIDLSGLYYDRSTGHIFVISDTENLIMEFSRGYACLAVHAFPGENQEGITADAEGFVYMAQDSGGVIKLKWQKPVRPRIGQSGP